MSGLMRATSAVIPPDINHMGYGARIGDEHRRGVAAHLKSMKQRGYLGEEELKLRLDHLAKAVTTHQLAGLVSDLPEPPVAWWRALRLSLQAPSEGRRRLLHFAAILVIIVAAVLGTAALITSTNDPLRMGGGIAVVLVAIALLIGNIMWWAEWEDTH